VNVEQHVIVEDSYAQCLNV